MSGAYLFIEAAAFIRVVKEYFGQDDAYAALQSELAENPEKAK